MKLKRYGEAGEGMIITYNKVLGSEPEESEVGYKLRGELHDRTCGGENWV
jgi:hypothetical protein